MNALEQLGQGIEEVEERGSFMSDVIWFVTGNTSKFNEAKQHFSRLSYDFRQFDPGHHAIVEPQSTSIEEVAQSKLEQAQRLLQEMGEVTNVLVEDAGLFIQPLDGFPGIYSSYVQETIGLEGILRLLNHLQSENPNQLRSLRTASFKAVAKLSLNGALYEGDGECKGYIATSIRGDSGFGFDPIFIPNDLDVTGESVLPGEQGELSTHGATFGEVSMEMKAKFSHRQRALDRLLSTIESG